MNERNLAVGLLVFVLVAFGGLIAYDVKYGHKFEKRFGTKEPSQNWKWEDDWSGRGSPPPSDRQVIPGPGTPDTPRQQLIVGSYQEALKKSGELGVPALVFFTSEDCSWCKKMKSETMTDSRVKGVLSRYILVYVDTDADRTVVRKFGITGLPSYVVTNYKEDKLKADNGFKNPDSFASWLSDQKLFAQPKAEPGVPEIRPQPQQPKPQPRPQVRPQPRQQPGCPPGGG